MSDNQDMYCRACRFSVKHFSWLVGDLDKYRKKSEKTVSKEFLDAIGFSGFDLEPWETHILSYTFGLFFFILLIGLDIIFFIFIHLALVELIPAVSIVGVKIVTVTLVLVYNIGLPLFTFLYSEFILPQRPATFSPPDISDKHPELTNISSIRKNIIIIALIAGAAVGFSGYVRLCYGNPFNIISKEAMAGLVLPTFPIIWAITAMICVYCLGIYTPYKKIRDCVKQIENEFADALFILGRRIAEGRSAEEAFGHTSETMKGSKIGESFADIAKNLTCMRTTLHGAIFNEEYGALKDIYSDRVFKNRHYLKRYAKHN